MILIDHTSLQHAYCWYLFVSVFLNDTTAMLYIDSSDDVVDILGILLLARTPSHNPVAHGIGLIYSKSAKDIL